MKPIRLYLVLFALLSVSSVYAQEYRTFIGSNGKQIEAILLNYDSDTEIVKIRLKQGNKEQNVKLSLFSDKDQQWIKNQGKADNPFDGNNPEPSNEVIRISLLLDEYGDATVRIERPTQSANDCFQGTSFQLKGIPKSKILKNEKGLVQITHDFSDPDPLDRWQKIKVVRPDGSIFDNGCRLNPKLKVLELKPVDQNKFSSIDYPRSFKLPLTISLDVLESQEHSGDLRIQFVKRLAVPDDTDPLFFVKIKRTGKNTCQIEAHYGNTIMAPSDKAIFREKEISFVDPWEKKFRLPLPSALIKNPFTPYIFYTPDPSINPVPSLRFNEVRLTGKLVPMLGQMPTFFLRLGENDSQVFVKSVSKEPSEQTGIVEGDIIKTINEISFTSGMEAEYMVADSPLGEDIVFKIERRGEEKVVVIKTDW